jgi:hypothetical protein
MKFLEMMIPTNKIWTSTENRQNLLTLTPRIQIKLDLMEWTLTMKDPSLRSFPLLSTDQDDQREGKESFAKTKLLFVHKSPLNGLESQ